MFPNRIRISAGASEKLKYIKSKTGVTPNVLCRIAIGLSLKDHKLFDAAKPELGGLEFNSSTLFGTYAKLYECLFKQLYSKSEIADIETIIANHIDEGMKTLRTVRSLSDLAQIR